MPRGRWKQSNEELAIEAYAVLIERHGATRSYKKRDLISALDSPAVYVDFLKLCLEHDDTLDLGRVLHRPGLGDTAQGLDETHRDDVDAGSLRKRALATLGRGRRANEQSNKREREQLLHGSPPWE